MALLCLFFINARTSLIFLYETVKQTNKPKQEIHVKVTVQREKSDIDVVKYLQEGTRGVNKCHNYSVTAL